MKSRLARRFMYLFLAVALVLAMGTAGFTLIEGYPVFDAFYMTLTTMTTVGYAEIHPLDRAGRIFNSFIVFFGVCSIFTAVGIMTQTIIEQEFGEVLSKRRNRHMVEKLEQHYIICGFGRVGRGAAAELQRAGVPFVVIDRDPERVERAMHSGMLAMQADSTRDDTLREAGIARAKGLISALATDADNLFVILSAKGLNPSLYVVTRAAEEGADEKMRRAGANHVLAPYAIAGLRLAQSLLRPHVMQFLDVTTRNIGLDVDMEQIPVNEASEVVSKSIRDLQIRRELGVIVLAIRKHDGQMLFNPPAETVILGGDYLIVMGKPEQLHRLEEMVSSPRASGA